MWTGRYPRRRRAAMSTSCSKEIMEQPKALRDTIFPACGGPEVVLDGADHHPGGAGADGPPVHHRLRLLLPMIGG